MTAYRTIQGYGRAEIEEKRSLFIGSAEFVTSEEEATAFVMRIRAEFPDARHNVYAYLIREGAKTRYSDDREPQGTAGLPVLEVLRKNGCLNAAIVVTRYFGGILLGAGGLVRAYTEAAAAALRAAGPVLCTPCVTYCLTCPYGEYQRLSRLLEQSGAMLGEPEFGAEVSLPYTVRFEDADRVTKEVFEATNGRLMPKKTGDGWQKLPL